MKVATFIAEWIAKNAPHVYAVPGGMAMHLNDAICHHPGISVLGMHHEQACAYAAEAHARVTGRPAVVHVTCGPGGINALTGIHCAYTDSIPMLVIAGQVAVNMIAPYGMRQLGATEGKFIECAKPITKFADTVYDPAHIDWYLETALHYATTGRKGPAVLEIPIDVSGEEINSVVSPLEIRERAVSDDVKDKARKAVELLARSERPVIIIGNGVRDAVPALDRLLEYRLIPVVSSWNASDIFYDGDPWYVGRCGQFGDRAANFAVQNADLILAIGTRLSIPQIGHHAHLFAPNAKKIIVDIDPAELKKHTINVDLAVCADAAEFLEDLSSRVFGDDLTWPARCRQWKRNYPVCLQEYRNQQSPRINSYAFIDELSNHLPDDAIVVTDVGMSFVGTMQALRLKRGQRLFHSSGLAPMGYGLPAAIGACMASDKKRPVVLIAGDGGMMFNVQELATIAHHRLPISIFVYENDGYHAMRATQANYFGRESLSSKQSGISCPDFTAVGLAFGVTVERIHALPDARWFKNHFDGAKHRPILVAMTVPRDQPLIPRVQSRIENGKFVPVSLEDMYPYLPREELARNMVAVENAAVQ